MIIGDDTKTAFYSAFVEALYFGSDDDIHTNRPDLADETASELKAHCESFLLRALVWLNAENEKRAEKWQPLKTVNDLGHDFYFTAFGHGVGFWECGDSDWNYYGRTLDKLACNYFYSGCSAYVGDDGLLYVG